MSHHPLWRASFLLMVGTPAALLAGCAQAPAPEKTPPAPVKWEPASRVPLEEWTELVGTTQPLPDCVARVTAPIDGRVVSLLHGKEGKPLQEGDVVAEGEVIARLDDRIPRLNVAKAESAVKTAAQEKAQAQTALGLAADKLTNLRNLRTKSPSLVPDIDLKTAEGAEADARSKLLTAEQLQEQAAKEQEALKQQLQLYALTAPHKGRLGRIQASLGQTLALGATVAEVVDLDDRIDVLCFVSQRVGARLQVGQGARLGAFGATPAEGFTTGPEGAVVYIADQAEPETGCFAVKVRFPNKDSRLRGNVVQRVLVLTQAVGDALALPESALLEDQDPPSVEIVENVKTETDGDNKDEQTGIIRRLSARVGVHDRLRRQVAILGLEDPEGEWKGDLAQALFVTEKGQGLQTGDPVRLEKKEE